MRRTSALSVTCIALASALCVSAVPAGAADYYLKLSGVDGESGKAKGKAKSFEGQLRVDSWTLGSAQTSSAGPSGSGRVTVDAALPGCKVGTRYRTAEVAGPNGSYALTDVTVAGCSIGNVALDYAAIRAAAGTAQSR